MGPLLVQLRQRLVEMRREHRQVRQLVCTHGSLPYCLPPLPSIPPSLPPSLALPGLPRPSFRRRCACKKASAGPPAWTVSVPFASSNDTFTIVTKPTGDLCRPYNQDELWLYRNGIFVQTLGCKNERFSFASKVFVPSGLCCHAECLPY